MRLTKSPLKEAGICERKLDLASVINNFLHCIGREMDQCFMLMQVKIQLHSQIQVIATILNGNVTQINVGQKSCSESLYRKCQRPFTWILLWSLLILVPEWFMPAYLMYVSRGSNILYVMDIQRWSIGEKNNVLQAFFLRPIICPVENVFLLYWGKKF